VLNGGGKSEGLAVVGAAVEGGGSGGNWDALCGFGFELGLGFEDW
jgi:hypothetical protein